MRAHRRNFALVAVAATAALSLGLAGCTSADTTDDSSSSDSNPDKEIRDGGMHEGPGQGADLATTEFNTSWQDAVDTASGSFDGELTEVALGWEDNVYAYTIEMVSDTGEYTTHIDASTGELIDDRGGPLESDDVDQKQAEVVDLDAIVPWNDALATALDAHKGTVNKWTLEGTDRGVQWQFDVDAESGDDVEVTVDATTGKLITADD